MGGACTNELTTRALGVKQAHHTRVCRLLTDRHDHRKPCVSRHAVHQLREPGQGHLILAIARQRLISELLPNQLPRAVVRSEEHTSELQSRPHLVCRLLLEKKKKKI